ncbi:nucleoside deaminase [Sulfurimonas sp. HSL3-7]|uniref:nucleoside deaminase n=1 Tax=Sulfonitrofixus jiaomeiensis TaxID=3131938 RepID=UPI0031F8006B
MMNKWMKIAHNEATEGMLANDGGPFGAVIVHRDKVIATAHNEVLKTNDPTAHAEINAIRIASEQLGSFDLSECVLYCTCKPCPMCLGAIFWARIGTVYYGATEFDAARGGFDDQRFYEMIRGQNHDVVLKQIDYEVNAKLFDQWLAKEDRQMY